jgi:hypothetical protein
MNAKPGERPITSIHEYVLGWSFVSDQYIKLLRCMRPQWTQTQLVAFAADLHPRLVSIWRVGETKVADGELRRFISASASIVQEQY